MAQVGEQETLKLEAVSLTPMLGVEITFKKSERKKKSCNMVEWESSLHSTKFKIQLF